MTKHAVVTKRADCASNLTRFVTLVFCHLSDKTCRSDKAFRMTKRAATTSTRRPEVSGWKTKECSKGKELARRNIELKERYEEAWLFGDLKKLLQRLNFSCA